MTRHTFSLREASELLGVSSMTLARQVDSGKVPAIKIGRRRLIPKEYIRRLFAESGFPLPVATRDTPNA